MLNHSFIEIRCVCVCVLTFLFFKCYLLPDINLPSELFHGILKNKVHRFFLRYYEGKGFFFFKGNLYSVVMNWLDSVSRLFSSHDLGTLKR